MDIIRQVQIGSAELRLTARDRYNDYSVVYDYALELEDREHNVFRTWSAGTNKRDATELYFSAIPLIRKLHFS